MCGICGVIHFDGVTVTEPTLRAMNERLRHRDQVQSMVVIALRKIVFKEERVRQGYGEIIHRDFIV